MKTINAISKLSTSLVVVFMLTFTTTEAQVEQDLFHLVSKSDHIGIAEAISNGHDVNHQTKAGNTALMVAAKIGDARVLKALLSGNADVNLRNKAGATALMIAAKYDFPHYVSALLKHGADPTIKTNKGYTAATFALGYKRYEIYDLLKKAENKFIALQ